MKLIIFGTGKFYQNRKQRFENEEIVAFVDNDEKKYNQLFEGVPVIAPSKISEIEYDFICLMARGEFVEQMRKQLEQLQVPYEKILDYFEYGMLSEGNKITLYYGRKCVPNDNKKILLLTHELSYSGAPLVLFYVAQILRRKGFFVAVLSLKDGELRKDFIREGVAVGIQEDIRRFDPVLFEWFQQFDLVWGNTVTYYFWVEAFGRTNIPFIWWLHESAEAYEWLGPHRMPRQIGKNVYIYAVGSLALAMARKYIPNGKTEELLYGTPDFSNDVKTVSKQREKVIFGIIGTINARKAQDIFIDAIEKLSCEERAKAEFWIIGSILNQEFYEKIKPRIGEIQEIKEFGACNREEMKNLYAQIDVVVCPSREDPLPVVVTEAMIMSKPAIVSTMTGTAALITDQENGFICETGEAEELAKTMEWILHNTEKLCEIGKNARKLYESNFAMNVFERNINKIVEEVLMNRR